MYRNNTWTLVSHLDTHNIVWCKWLFHTKYPVDGSIERHKARLVAQVSVKFPMLIFRIPLAWLLKHLPFMLSCHWRLLIIGCYIN